MSEQELRAEVARLQAIIDTHDLCHNLQGIVGADDFADGCAQEQRKHFGCAPHADKVQAQRVEIDRLSKALRSSVYPVLVNVTNDGRLEVDQWFQDRRLTLSAEPDGTTSFVKTDGTGHSVHVEDGYVSGMAHLTSLMGWLCPGGDAMEAAQDIADRRYRRGLFVGGAFVAAFVLVFNLIRILSPQP